MRINKFVALATGISRRSADEAIEKGHVLIDGSVATAGDQVDSSNTVKLDSQTLEQPDTITILLHKPVGYVVSRDGQGSKTVYDLLPKELHGLKPIGRLDKDSSGLLLLTNDGDMANQLTHPRHQKEKIYEVVLDKPLTTAHQKKIETGVMLDDGLSNLKLNGSGAEWTVIMFEGRNRQIRRTFAYLGYTLNKLHRTHFGAYSLDKITEGKFLRY